MTWVVEAEIKDCVLGYTFIVRSTCKTNIRWDSEPVLGLVTNPRDVIGKLFHRQRQKSWKRF